MTEEAREPASRIEKLCAEHGLRMTAPRRVIARVLSDASDHPDVDEVYRRVFDEIVLPACRRFKPQLVLVSAGFDAHAADPLGSMRLTEGGFADLAQRAVDLAETSCDGKVIACLEGGYDRGGLARSVAAVLRAFDGTNRDTNGKRTDTGGSAAPR